MIKFEETINFKESLSLSDNFKLLTFSKDILAAFVLNTLVRAKLVGNKIAVKDIYIPNPVDVQGKDISKENVIFSLYFEIVKEGKVLRGSWTSFWKTLSVPGVWSSLPKHLEEIMLDGKKVTLEKLK